MCTENMKATDSQWTPQCLLVLLLRLASLTIAESLNCWKNYTLENGRVNWIEGDSTVNSTFEVVCNFGYRMFGPPKIQCLEDGSWSKDTHCHPEDCGDSFGVANGYINWTNAETTFNSSVPVYCNVSYKLKGDDKITCLGNGTWSQNTFCRSAAATTESKEPTDMNLVIPIVAGVVVSIIVLTSVALTLYLKRTRKLCFAKPAEGLHFDQLEMELKVWSKFRPGVVKLKDFSAYIDVLHKDNNKMFSDGFKLLNDRSPYYPTTVAESPSCISKTRYTDILPFDHSRVKLLPIEEVEGSDFINASYVSGYKSSTEYIATQTPLKETINDFWRMVWEQNVDIIVMLSKRFGPKKGSLPRNYSVEKHGTSLVFDQYWPEQVQESVHYGDLEVNMLSESVLSGYITRVMEVKLDTETRIVTQINFLKWPDHGCPRKIWPFLNFVTMVRQYSPQQMVVHCSTGVSRTGTFIAVDRLLQHVRDHDNLDIYSVILDMRHCRCNMVKTEEQFIFVYECLRHFITAEPDYEDDERGSTVLKGNNSYNNIAFEEELTV